MWKKNIFLFIVIIFKALLKLATSHLQKKAPVVPDGDTYKWVFKYNIMVYIF